MADAVGTVTTAPIPTRTRATTGKGRFVLDGQRFFPIMAWWQCPAEFDALLGLGINVLMGGCKALYVIAVNPSYDPATAIVRLKGIGSRSFTVFGESRTLQTRRSLLVDRFDPLAVHVYVAAPR